MNSSKEMGIIINPELEQEFNEFVEKNKDEYGWQVVMFVKDFANYMQSGKSFEEAEDYAIKGKGLTGFMVGAGISALAHFLPEPSNEAVRVWWNAKWNVTAPMGTVDPSGITLKVKNGEKLADEDR